jgi:hypothetical protein
MVKLKNGVNCSVTRAGRVTFVDVKHRRKMVLGPPEICLFLRDWLSAGPLIEADPRKQLMEDIRSSVSIRNEHGEFVVFQDTLGLPTPKPFSV